jgi:hypothetical protein
VFPQPWYHRQEAPCPTALLAKSQLCQPLHIARILGRLTESHGVPWYSITLTVYNTPCKTSESIIFSDRSTGNSWSSATFWLSLQASRFTIPTSNPEPLHEAQFIISTVPKSHVSYAKSQILEGLSIKSTWSSFFCANIGNLDPSVDQHNKYGTYRLLLRTRGRWFQLGHSLSGGFCVPHASSLHVEEIFSPRCVLTRRVLFSASTLFILTPSYA